MAKGYNLQILEYKQELIKVINASQLPASVQRMCIAEILGQVDALVAQQIEMERAAEKEGDAIGEEICKG